MLLINFYVLWELLLALLTKNIEEPQYRRAKIIIILSGLAFKLSRDRPNLHRLFMVIHKKKPINFQINYALI